MESEKGGERERESDPAGEWLRGKRMEMKERQKEKKRRKEGEKERERRDKLSGIEGLTE